MEFNARSNVNCVSKDCWSNKLSIYNVPCFFGVVFTKAKQLQVQSYHKSILLFAKAYFLVI